MNGFLEEYVEAGYSGIVVTGHEFEESSSGHKETTIETIVAMKGDIFISAIIRQTINIYKSGLSRPMIEETKISEREYRKAVKGNEIIDTPDDLRRLKREALRRKLNERLHKKLLASAPDCPDCGSTMTMRTGSHGEFWGCAKFPSCRGTRNLSTESRRLHEKWGNA